MKVLLRLVLLAVIALPIAATVAIWMCFQATPLLPSKADVSATDIERVKRLVERNDPRKSKEGAMRVIVLSQQDIDLLVDYASNHFRRASTRVVLRPAPRSSRRASKCPKALSVGG